MKARYAVSSLLLASLVALGAPAANANDELAGALLGAGAGAVIGHAVNGQDGAVVGGFLGALIGASVADDDGGRGRAVIVRPGPRPYYAPPAVRYYAPPRPWVGPAPYWRNDRDWRHDGPRYDDRDGRRGDRDHDRDRDRDRRHDDRDSRGDGSRDYHNW